MAAVLPAPDHFHPAAADTGLAKTTAAPGAHTALKGLSLNAKLCLAASVCTIASLVVTGVAVGLRSSQAAEESAKQSVRATGLYAASQVQSDLQATFKSIGALATALTTRRRASSSTPRSSACWSSTRPGWPPTRCGSPTRWTARTPST